MTTSITVLSLFDGMSCGQIAINRSNISLKSYFASEVDKYAIMVAKENYPSTKHLGDVRDISYGRGVLVGDLEDTHPVGLIDLLIGGSPCQNFSFAGSRKGMVTKDSIEIVTLDQYLQLKEEGFQFHGQSFLFWEYVRILKEIQAENPNVEFILENVKMDKKWENLITSILDVKPIVINSSLVSAQNRVRLYWTNIPGISQPQDRGILLKHIIDYSASFKNTFTPKKGEGICKLVGLANGIKGHDILKRVYSIDGKAPTLTAGKGGNQGVKIAKPINLGNVNPSGYGQNGNVYSIEEEPSCITANKREEIKVADFVGISQRARGNNKGGLHKDKSTTLTSNSWEHNHVAVFGDVRPANIVGRRLNERGVREDDNPNLSLVQCLQVKNTEKSGCLTTVEKDCLLSLEEPGRYPDVYNRTDPVWRKLTPVECERLQTVPDGYTKSVSNSQRYRMLGNGWTVDVIAHILSYSQYNKKP